MLFSRRQGGAPVLPAVFFRISARAAAAPDRLKTEKACAAARFPVLMLFYGAQNGHGTVVDEAGPLPHRGLLTFQRTGCLLYTSDAADEEDSVDLCCPRII